MRRAAHCCYRKAVPQNLTYIPPPPAHFRLHFCHNRQPHAAHHLLPAACCTPHAEPHIATCRPLPHTITDCNSCLNRALLSLPPLIDLWGQSLDACRTAQDAVSLLFNLGAAQHGGSVLFSDEQKLLFEGWEKGFVMNTKLDFMRR
jgi:hypothetical protein